MARLLQPSIVVLEDVDLIAEERTREGACSAVLFELLNQMDGLADDADILFLLTTNRPDILEPALASRPGRIDQAIEIPLPDAACRRRLLELYGRGLTLRRSTGPVRCQDRGRQCCIHSRTAAQGGALRGRRNGRIASCDGSPR
jgi:ATP-dependent 26S proteasome regulatory subunit